jgi:hypothetical protein
LDKVFLYLCLQEHPFWIAGRDCLRPGTIQSHLMGMRVLTSGVQPPKREADQ